MAICINKNTPEYQSLKQRAGVPDVVLSATCSLFIEKYGRLPYLDEIIGSNSEKHIKDTLKIKKDSTTSIPHILETTKSNTIEDALSKLNNEYRDKEITLTPIGDDTIVEIKDRPKQNITKIDKINTPQDIPNSILITNAINKLADIYGIKVNEVNDYELSTDKWNHLMPRDRVVNAFIYNGEIYINTDKASADSKIHELLHLFIGSLRNNEPTLYYSLVELAELLPQYESLLEDYNDKTRNAANEEIFIQELAKYLAGMESALDKLDDKTLYEITYNVNRVLDSILMGSLSVNTIENSLLYNCSLKDIVKYTNSDIMTSTYSGTLNMEGSEIYRRLDNMKSDLLKRNLLLEICD